MRTGSDQRRRRSCSARSAVVPPRRFPRRQNARRHRKDTCVRRAALRQRTRSPRRWLGLHRAIEAASRNSTSGEHASTCRSRTAATGVRDAKTTPQESLPTGRAHAALGGRSPATRSRPPTARHGTGASGGRQGGRATRCVRLSAKCDWGRPRTRRVDGHLRQRQRFTTRRSTLFVARGLQRVGRPHESARTRSHSKNRAAQQVHVLGVELACSRHPRSLLVTNTSSHGLSRA